MVVQQFDMGKGHARDAVRSVLQEFSVGLIVCLGIAGSLTSDLKLGDVAYSANILDVYDNQKVADHTGGGVDLALSQNHYAAPAPLIAALNFSRTMPRLQAIYTEWQERQKKFAHSLEIKELPDRSGKLTPIERPQSLSGSIICAAVTKSEAYNAKLRGLDRRAIAVETEAGGIVEEVRTRNIPIITIRGISDHADPSKNRLEAETGNACRKIAARNASTFLRMEFNNEHFVRYVKTLKQNGQLDLRDKSQPPATIEPTQIIQDASEYITEKLRELSPEYRLQQQGYRLPIPRMRQSQSKEALASGEPPAPEEILEALTLQNAVLLSLPRNYPDRSLPWVIAKNLLSAELGGKSVFPVVIKGTEIRPPKYGLESQAHYEFLQIEKLGTFQIVFIIDEPNLDSNTRLKHLEKEIQSHTSAKFVLITRASTQVVTQSNFASAISAQLYQLDNISFLEISHFLEKNFAMAGSEAEVVALRLRNTFQHFRMSAHPTYFAAISKDVLAALLQANRRSELIQLAVDGFLTIVAADDSNVIPLSRSARARFLRKVAVEINVEKRPISRDDLIRLASTYSQEHDFGVDPILFISSFLNKGVLHFENDYVRFSLPFMESYLLASALHELPELALRYFNLSDHFDLNTFDLYAEIGATSKIIDLILKELTEACEKHKLHPDQQHIALTESFNRVARPDRILAMRKHLTTVASDVEAGRGDTKHKQKMLDIADRLRDGASRETKAFTKKIEFNGQQAKLISELSGAVHSWLIGATLLGAGAEHLDADTKQKIASLLIQLAASISHHMMSVLCDLNFGELREEFTKPEMIAELRKGDDEISEEDMKKFISDLFETMEFTWVSSPLQSILRQLCEHARQRILATSIEKIQPSNMIESIVHAAWLSDIDSGRGQALLVQKIRSLPRVAFIRMLLAFHFMNRAYWSHWKREDRLALIDAAAEAVSVFQIKLQTNEIEKMIAARLDGN